MKHIVELYTGFKLSIEDNIESPFEFNYHKGYNVTLESPEGHEITSFVHPNDMEVIKNMLDSIMIEV